MYVRQMEQIGWSLFSAAVCFVTHRSVYRPLSNTHLLLSGLFCVVDSTSPKQSQSPKKARKAISDEHDFTNFSLLF